MIPFNKPAIVGNEFSYMQQALENGKISGNGIFTQKCHDFFQSNYGFKKVLLTGSCTDALEMAAILSGIEAGDEVIVPSFSFSSCANAFILRGAKVIFADSESEHPNISVESLKGLISKKTKAILVVHYAGMASRMNEILAIAERHSLFVIEDCAHSIHSFYNGKPLGSLGHFAAFSFHETKNLTCGEGGMLVINDERFLKRSEIIWEKGTNRTAFFRGETDRYNWVDVGSSFLPSELSAAFLFAQLEQIGQIQKRRISVWNSYAGQLQELSLTKRIQLPRLPDFSTLNASIFYIITGSVSERDQLIRHLEKNDVLAVFHYQPLHCAPYATQFTQQNNLINALKFSERLIRLPLFFDLESEKVRLICDLIKKFYRTENLLS